MKNSIVFCSAFLFLCALSLNGQNDTIWFDSNWKETPKKDAAFFRPEIQKKNKGFWVVDYYINGAKQMEGLSKTAAAESFDGVVTWYYDNGITHQIVNYDQGVLKGKRQQFFTSGKIKSESSYKNGKMDGKWKEFYENGNAKETGNFESGQKEGNWKTFYLNGEVNEEGKYVFDRKVDVWKTHHYDGTDQKE